MTDVRRESVRVGTASVQDGSSTQGRSRCVTEAGSVFPSDSLAECLHLQVSTCDVRLLGGLRGSEPHFAAMMATPRSYRAMGKRRAKRVLTILPIWFVDSSTKTMMLDPIPTFFDPALRTPRTQCFLCHRGSTGIANADSSVTVAVHRTSRA